jgi:hypothetical protein
MLEVYTSQGCSSCPPAEAWINTLKSSQNIKHKNNRLWKDIIPMNFHVDYWDYLGWKDPFSKKTFSQRQRRYAQLKHANTIATPGFIVDGKGWNGWFRDQKMPIFKQPSPGKLIAEVNHNAIDISYQPKQSNNQSLSAHVAILSFNQKTHIPKGENHGKTLKHDFIVTDYYQQSLSESGSRFHTQQLITHAAQFNSKEKAIVVWVALPNDPKPIQVVADWL